MNAGLLRRDAGIAGKNHAEGLILQGESDGVAIDRVEGQRRADKCERYAIFGFPNHARARIDDWNATRVRRSDGIAIGVTAKPLTAGGKLADP